ncbi:DUF3068 domain-containing protein [Streptosporangium sp. NPDC023615]|uniref:DUF3068 domain-containing protein n=1 Tax=Streptosporangium sp. NPDC023615 TaxID=3154794 RepID=UPI003417C533
MTGPAASDPKATADPTASGETATGRRLRGVLVLVTGAFLITLAVLVRFYVHPSGLVLPAEQDRITMMSTESGSYFDAAALRVRRGVPLEQAVARYGDPVRSTPDVAVWTEFVSLATRDGRRVDYHERRLAFDRRTAQAFPCCEDYVDENPDPAPRGLLFRWPFDARPVAYPVYDPLARRPVSARFDGIETLYGVRVYRYAQRLVNEPYAQQPMRLPGSVLGLREPAVPKRQKNPGSRGEAVNAAAGAEQFPVQAYLDGTRTFWVEPTSGMVIGVRENLVRTLRTPDGRGRLVALAADLRTSAGDERWNAGEAEQFLRRATLVNWVIPLAAGLLGVVLLAAGLRLHLRAVPAGGDPPGRDPEGAEGAEGEDGDEGGTRVSEGGATGAGAGPGPRSGGG